MLYAGNAAPWALDPDVVLWAGAVMSNGGTVSSGRAALVSALVTEMKSGGSWQRTDDCWIWTKEAGAADVQALTSLKQRRLATAVNSPTIDDGGLLSDGSTSYVDLNFSPGSHAVAMTGTDMRLAVYERTNLGQSSYAAGVADSGISSLRMIPRSSSDSLRGSLNSASSDWVAGVADGRGLLVMSRSAAGIFEAFGRGVSLGTTTPSPTGTTLPVRTLCAAAQNSVGTIAGFRAAAQGCLSVGASLTAAQELAEYNAWQRFFTAIGKAV